MNDAIPIITDREGTRWARVAAKAFALRGLDHDTRQLAAESLTVSDPVADAPTLGGWLRDASARIYLKGDEFHTNDYYDITDAVRRAFDGTEVERDDLMARLAGRHLLRTAVARTKRPNWWTAGLGGRLAELVASVDADGILLGDDWSPDFDPEYPSYPWASSLAERVERFSETAAWLFETGEPSVEARLRTHAALRTLALENLASAAATACRRLGIAFPLNRQRRWWMSPLAAAERGFVPFLTTGLPLALENFAGSELMRLSESASAAWLGVRSRFAASRASDGALDFAAGAGFALEAGEAPRVDVRGRPRADALVLVSREDGWAHGWDGASREHQRLAGRLVETLSAKGVSYLVVDESGFAGLLAAIAPLAVIVAPCRSVSAVTVATLCEWTDGKRQIGWVEPVPYLVAGARYAALDDLLARRRVRRFDVDDDASLLAFLRKNRVASSLGVFDRTTGDPLTEARRQTVVRDGERMDTFAVGETPSPTVLVALDGEWKPERFWRNGIESNREPFRSWRADGSAYCELPLARGDVYTMRAVSPDDSA